MLFIELDPKSTIGFSSLSLDSDNTLVVGIV